MISWKYEKLLKFDEDFVSKKSDEPDCTEAEYEKMGEY